MTLNTLCIFGTRPEAIKMAPLIKKLNQSPISNKVCITGQHQEMLNSVLDLFHIVPDFNLKVMSANQTLSQLTAKILIGLEMLFKTYKPNLVFVHGDTTTTLAASLAAYYHRIDVAHVEAGLRTGNVYSPWPEEINRKLTGSLAKFHFAPTTSARLNLLNEGISPNSIVVTGNTGIDALHDISNRLDTDKVLWNQLCKQFYFLSAKRKMILVTGHRRENFGSGFQNICESLRQLALMHPDIDIVYPVHLNPNVQKPVYSLLKDLKNVYLIAPVDYAAFVYLIKQCYLILTDSGGVQEEAPALGKPVLVMREITERPEALVFGGVKLVGSNTEKIIIEVNQLLLNETAYASMIAKVSPYGDGTAANQIVAHLSELYFVENHSVGACI